MDNTKRIFDLTSFITQQSRMVATNEQAWQNSYLSTMRSSQLKDYTPNQVEKIINDGDLSQQQQLSQVYFYKNGFYKQILMYYATLLKYSGILIPNPKPGTSLSQSFISKKYYNALNFIESLTLPSTLTNLALKILINGCYYGTMIKTNKNNFVLFDLPAAFCRTRYKDYNNNDIVEFDVRYFNSIIDATLKKSALKAYPKKVAQHYEKWAKGKITEPWVMIPTDTGVCFPLFDGRPLFLNIIPATIKYDETVEIEQQRDLEEIRKIIVQKVPHLNDGTLLFEPEEAAEMHVGAVNMMKKNPNVSVLTTYTDVESILSKTTSDSLSNNLEKMMHNIFYEAGVTNQLFAAKGNLSTEASVKKDTALMMMIANKFSTFITTLINDRFGNANIDFKYSILPITYHNDSTFLQDSFKLAQSGYSYLLPNLALGVSQRDIYNLKDLENNLLKLTDVFIPLSSAYTQSSSDNEGAGAPKKSIDDKSPNTVTKDKSLDKGGSI